MSQIFHPGSNALARVTLYGGLVGVLVIIALVELWYRTTWVTNTNIPRLQPVPFSHEHHVRGLGLDCRYCHTSVEDSSFAGLPPTHTCMTCHSRIWTDAKMLQPVRDSLLQDRPIRWKWLNELPDYVYFDHSIHVAKGVACVTCHGPIGDMPLTWRQRAWHMSDCLECHRDPASNIVPKDEVFGLDAKPDPEVGRWLVKKNPIRTTRELTDCSVCHR